MKTYIYSAYLLIVLLFITSLQKTVEAVKPPYVWPNSEPYTGLTLDLNDYPKDEVVGGITEEEFKRRTIIYETLIESEIQKREPYIKLLEMDLQLFSHTKQEEKVIREMIKQQNETNIWMCGCGHIFGTDHQH